MDVLFAAGPIVGLIYLMTKRHPLPSAVALPLAAGAAYLVQLLWFGAGGRLVNASVVAGLLVAWTPILIVWGAIFFFRSMEHCGAMGTIRAWLNHLSRNRVAQVMLIGWSFQFLIEGASGFGTPAALAGPLLVGLGFPALRVATACLVLNSVPVSFGAVGAPTWFGFGQLGLDAAELRAVAWKTALIHSVAACMVPLLALRLLVEWREIRENLAFIYLSIGASVAPMFFVALLNDEFPSVAGGLTGLAATVWLARHGIGLAREGGAGAEERGEAPAAREVARALFPIGATVAALLATRIPALGLRGLLTSGTPSWEFSLGELGTFTASPSLVVGLRGILGTELDWTHQVLYVPSLLPFIAVSAVSFWVLGAPAGTAGAVWRESLGRMRNPVPALLGALVFVRLLMAGGESSPVMILGNSLAAATGGWWQLLAAHLGALGAFFAGSNTISNLTFGPIQDSIALRLGLDRTTILALQSAGGAMGNMVAIHNIVAVCSVLGLGNMEGVILKKTVGPMLAYGAVAMGMALLL